MSRKLEVERLLRLYGAEARGWRGGKLEATCPFAPWTHASGKDSKPSFVVMEGRNNHYSYKCLACGEGGSLPKMVWRMAALGAQYQDEASILAYGWEADEIVRPPVKDLDYSVGGRFSFEGPTLRRQIFQGTLLPQVSYRNKEKVEYEPPDTALVDRWIAAPMPYYVTQRGFEEVHVAWRLGYNAKERRWVHPIRNVKQELVGYTARLCWDKPHCYNCGALISDKRFCEGCKINYAKYKHHAGPWRRENLFGIERHVKGEPIVVTEGTTDALNLWRHGVRHPVAILGASISAGQAQLIAQRTERVFVMGDGDQAGRKMAVDVVDAMRRYGINVVVLDCGDGRDPGDLAATEVESLFAAY
jgi:hypothetical protein